MTTSMDQKEMKLAEQFKARTAPEIPVDWQKNLMAGIRQEKLSATSSLILEDEKFIFRFAIASALSAAAAVLIFISVHFYIGQATTVKTQDSSLFYGGIENIVDTI